MRRTLHLWYATVFLAALVVMHGCGSGLTDINGAVLTTIEVTPSSPSIPVGSNQQYTATGTYSDNSTHNLTNSIAWASSDTSKANITGMGLATAVSAGTITVTASFGSITGTATLTITPQNATLTSIAVTPANPSIAVATTQQFIATGTYSDNTTQDITGSVTWLSSNTGKATVTTSGLAQGNSPGLTIITAMSEGCSGDAILRVTPAELLSISVTPASSSVAAGTPWQFTAIGTYADATTQDITNTVIWSSSNPGTASISAHGLAMSAVQGTVTITAISGSVSGSATLTVTAPVLTSIDVAPGNGSLTQQGDLCGYLAIGTYSDSSTQDLTATVIWTSSAPGVATIDAAGQAQAVSAGTATITATAGNISGSAVLTVSMPVSLTSSVNGPIHLVSGMTITFTSQVTLPGSYEYLWVAQYPDNTSGNYTTPGNAPTVYSSTNTCTVTFDTVQTGTYMIGVWARQVGSSAPYEYVAYLYF